MINKRKWKQYVTILVTTLLCCTMFSLSAEAAVNNGAVYPISSNEIQGWPQGPEVNCETAVLMNADNGAVLYNKGMNELRYPASITKIMTALLAIEKLSPDAEVTFSETAVASEQVAGSSTIHMQVGEKITVRDCLYALMIKSANEVAIQLAEEVAGTEDAFAQLMNQRASELGCKNTNFVNASGLPDENHYTTAYDMALIFRDAIKNETFREIIGSREYKIESTNLSPEPRNMNTSHPLIAVEAPEYYEGSIGGKSGSTEAAGKTLVTGAQRNGITYIVVVMKGTDMGLNCQDTINLFNYGYDNFDKLQLNGGTIVVPKGIREEQLQKTEEPENDGKILVQYSYEGNFVGTVYKEVSKEEPKEEIAVPKKENEEDNSEPSVKNTSDSFFTMTNILLCVMSVMIVLVIILIIILVKKDRKSKKRKRRKRRKK